jgi:hypothetical protein
MHKKQIPWNKGKNKENDFRVAKQAQSLIGIIRSEETRRKISDSKKGSKPWNKGKTAEDDSRILSGLRNGMYGKTHTNEVKQLLRELGKIKFGGKNNPWYGKNRSGELSPRYKPEILKRKYKNYLNKVTWLTEQTYCKYIKEINPNNFPRTLCGIRGGYQLDHIYPIYKGFLYSISPEDISKKENLRMLTWKKNRIKSDKLNCEV